jgi:hypothetical protein
MKTKRQSRSERDKKLIAQKRIEKRISIKVLKIFIKFFFIIFKKQQNLLSIYIDKKNSQKRKFKNF